MGILVFGTREDKENETSCATMVKYVDIDRILPMGGADGRAAQATSDGNQGHAALDA